MVLSWSQLDQVEGIEFESVSATRRVLATFYDAAGHSTFHTPEFGLNCDGLAAGDGVCVDLNTSPEHCGGCRAPVPEPCICHDGEPRCLGHEVGVAWRGGECVDTNVSDEHCGACDNPIPDLFDPYMRCYDGVPSCQPTLYDDPLFCGTFCSPPGIPRTCGSCDNNCYDQFFDTPEDRVYCESQVLCHAWVQYDQRVPCDQVCSIYSSICVAAEGQYLTDSA